MRLDPKIIHRTKEAQQRVFRLAERDQITAERRNVAPRPASEAA